MNNLPYTCVLILLLLCICRSQAADPMLEYCEKDSTIRKNSPISANIDALLAQLVSKTPSTGYSATSYGGRKSKDQVFGLAQCRGDVVGSKDCSSCIQEAAKQIRESCPDKADATIWYDFCFLRYSNKSFVGEVDTSYGVIFYNTGNVTDPENFKKELGALVDKIKTQALVPKNLGFGKGQKQLSPLVTLYAFGQCTRDLSKLGCSQCLANAVGYYETICGNRQGCRVLYRSCYIRYELYPIFYSGDSSNALNGAADKTLMRVFSP